VIPDFRTQKGAEMLSEMTKQAGCKLGERVKIAAAVVAMHNYDRTQDIIETAGEMKKTAALRGIDLPDVVALNGARETFEELDRKKLASYVGELNMTKTAAPAWLQRALGSLKGTGSKASKSLDSLMTSTPWAVPAAGAGLGAGAGALIDDEDRLRGALIGGGIGGLAGLGGQLAHTSKGLGAAKEHARKMEKFGVDYPKRQKLDAMARRRGAVNANDDQSLFYKAYSKLSPKERAVIDKNPFSKASRDIMEARGIPMPAESAGGFNKLLKTQRAAREAGY